MDLIVFPSDVPHMLCTGGSSGLSVLQKGQAVEASKQIFFFL